MDPDHLDQGPDLGLGAAQQEHAAAHPQPAGEQRQVDHQRDIREAQLGEVDDDIGRGPDRARDRAAPDALRRSILVACATEDWR